MKNFEELKQVIRGNSFNESHLSNTQVVDLETVIGLIEDFEQCNIANVVKAKRTCAKCDSTDVIMFTADLDICNNCGCTQDGA